jgi:hypothetical protein
MVLPQTLRNHDLIAALRQTVFRVLEIKKKEARVKTLVTMWIL